MTYATESSRWRAVQCRDESAASAFIYAVVTTKIFCRPSCPSRLARRANICFYNTVQEALNAGYRPCRRCKPDEATASHLDNKAIRKKAVDEACSYIEQTSGPVKFSDVAKHVNLSTRYLHGLFKEIMGMTPAKYAELCRSCQTLGPETSLSPVSLAIPNNMTTDVPFESAGLVMSDWTAGLESGAYDSEFFGHAADQATLTTSCPEFAPATACTGIMGNEVLLNEFDLLLDEALAEPWKQALFE